MKPGRGNKTCQEGTGSYLRGSCVRGAENLGLLSSEGKGGSARSIFVHKRMHANRIFLATQVADRECEGDASFSDLLGTGFEATIGEEESEICIQEQLLQLFTNPFAFFCARDEDEGRPEVKVLNQRRWRSTSENYVTRHFENRCWRWTAVEIGASSNENKGSRILQLTVYFLEGNPAGIDLFLGWNHGNMIGGLLLL